MIHNTSYSKFNEKYIFTYIPKDLVCYYTNFDRWGNENVFYKNCWILCGNMFLYVSVSLRDMCLWDSPNGVLL